MKKKLLLTRETIRSINQGRLGEVAGATVVTTQFTCPPSCGGTCNGASFCVPCSAPSDVACSRKIYE